MIPPVVWIPAGFALGLALVLWAGMSWAYDRGGRHVREELEALAAARSFRRLPRVPPHLERPLPPPAPGQQMWAARDWDRHEAEALAVAATRPDPHPSGPMPMRRLEAVPDELTDSQFTRRMAAEVAEGMAAVDAYLHGREP
jgi:hypothetical protein